MRGGGGGEEHSYSHTVRVITHTPLCCCQIAACAVAWVPAMHQQLMWRTQWHTPVRVIIIITCGCMSGRLSPAAAAVTERGGERRGHDAMTGVAVVVWLGVSSMCHAGTNKQHSIAWGRREEQPHRPVNVTHPPSPQPPAQTSSHQPAFGGKRPVVWLCETRIPFSLSTSAHTHTPDEATEKLKREEEEEVGWEGQAPAAPMGAITATRHHSCTAVPAHAE